MAGFTINGFGASDSYRTLKELKTARCPSCKRDTVFALMELKMRIRLLYIPTVPIGTKYAVACTRCKNGYYVNEEQRNFILDNPASVVTIASDGVVLHGIHAQKEAIEAPVVPQPPAEVPQPPVKKEPACVTLDQAELDAIFVQDTSDPADPKQEAPQPEKITRTAVCDAQKLDTGADIKQPAGSTFVKKEGGELVYERRKVCPSCRMMFAPDKQFCNICGSLLELK